MVIDVFLSAIFIKRLDTGLRRVILRLKIYVPSTAGRSLDI